VQGLIMRQMLDGFLVCPPTEGLTADWKLETPVIKYYFLRLFFFINTFKKIGMSDSTNILVYVLVFVYNNN
jgi:hypothetical protein